MSNKNEVFEYLIDQLRQQVDNNPYKQQCEDLAHEVLSLKNQLRDTSALVAELQGDNIKKSEHISHLTGRVKELHLALVQATGDVEAYKLIREQEQSGCRKDDTPECHHNWRFANGKAPAVCINCGVTKSSKCEHKWQFYGVGFPCMCLKCGLKSPGRQKEDTQESCWIEWPGGACPVPRGTLVDVVYRDGKTLYCLPADELHCTSRDASFIFWRHDGEPGDIVRYRKTVYL